MSNGTLLDRDALLSAIAACSTPRIAPENAKLQKLDNAIVVQTRPSLKRGESYDPKREDLKTSVSSTQPHVRSLTMQSVARGLKSRSLTIVLPLPYQFTTTAATTYNTVQSLDLTQISEFGSDLINLYDEVKIDRFRIQLSVLPFGYTTSTNSHICGIAYDPTNSGAAGSVTNVAQHGQHLLFACQPGGSSIPQAVSRYGLINWQFAPPAGVMRSTAIVAVHGKSEWVSCSDANIIFGYLKPYFPSIGATGVMYFDSMIFFTLSFRCRT
jgi:hypothetical protein